MRERRVLVTGSSGLIGTAVCAALSAQGHPVRRFDLVDDGGGRGDVRSLADLEDAAASCAGVVHLAAVSRVIHGEQDPGLCHETNVSGTRNLVEVLSGLRPRPWLILGSSREVYGQSALLPVTEQAPLRPLNHYARSKLAAERIVTQAGEGGLRCSVLRFSTVYGSSADHADRVIPAFCRAAIRDEPLRVEGHDTCLDITHVGDVADGIVQAGNALARGVVLAPMHLVSGQGTTLADLARRVIRLAGSDSAITTAPARSYDVSQFIGDPTLARDQIGWQPATALETGLAALIAEYRKRLALPPGPDDVTLRHRAVGAAR